MARKNKKQLADMAHTVTGIGWANTNQACFYAGITKPTLDRWIDDGLRCSRIVGCVRMKYTDIDEYMRRYELGANAGVDMKGLDELAMEVVAELCD